MPRIELCKYFYKIRVEGVFVRGWVGFWNSGTCSGTCLELLATDNQIVNRGNGTKCGNCLGSVLKLTIN